MIVTLDTPTRLPRRPSAGPVLLPAPAAVPEEAPDTVPCPECGRTAVVEWRALLDSTDGPVEHVKIRCPERHWFLMPA
jgi:hypothetical protein